ncbi:MULTISPECIES: GGDEF domain-containing protein [Atopobiaceae]|uniref:Diguanylate cyclase (GGDEF) domain-containing protein n=1 Tax=Parafannyhessea umbonata TaxID=604330 RepID=A0A1H6ING1_9ACTN|nr:MULTISPECIES: diguanylate cyclase [Atopobiaceae]SEH50614.1 diguanylate cyclase (GGDEF) domain-containing protein [Parafannyhessea umbonata]SJZ76662.1 diguanylate cyclase (GGDEF) domain-containing protein [Olsenella sp. KH1P3]
MLDLLKEKLSWWLCLRLEPEVHADISRINVRNLRTMAGIVLAIEVVTLAIALGMRDTLNVAPAGFYSVGIMIVMSAIDLFAAGRVLRPKRINATAASVLLVATFLLASAWGINVSLRHYMTGDQMLTFYTVQFCFACFISSPPVISLLLTGGAFACLYLVLLAINGANDINSINYAIFATIVILGSIARYRAQASESEQRQEIESLNKSLFHSSTHDELTETLNRVALRNHFPSFVGRELCVIMVDIDHFKHYNDSYGHRKGDEIIRAVAKELAGTFANGMTFRYGGDEFLIIIPIEGGDVSDIREQVQHWEKSVTDLSMSGVDEKIVCSHGLVHGTPDNASDLRTMIDGADAQLYLAKRNRSGD